VQVSEVVAPGRSEVAEAPLPSPKPGELLVGIECCGVCASEIWPWRRGPDGGAGLRLGHEAAGTVLDIGAGVEGFQPGDRVTGLIQPAFGDAQVVSQDLALRLPDGLAFEHGLGEPLGCMVNAWRRTPVEAGQRVAVIGVGFMGLGLLQLLKLAGPAELIAIDLDADALRRARDLGASAAYSPSEVRSDGGVDVVVEATGSQAGLALAGELVRAHGLLSIVGFHQGGPRTVDMELWNWKAIDVVNAHLRRHRDLMSSMQLGLELIRDGRFAFVPLVTHHFGLAHVDRAFEAMTTSRPEGFVKAVVLPGR
jgi:threonine dehydrogenase-like Zn-dependent dehydrogenase